MVQKNGAQEIISWVGNNMAEDRRKEIVEFACKAW